MLLSQYRTCYQPHLILEGLPSSKLGPFHNIRYSLQPSNTSKTSTYMSPDPLIGIGRGRYSLGYVCGVGGRGGHVLSIGMALEEGGGYVPQSGALHFCHLCICIDRNVLYNNVVLP